MKRFGEKAVREAIANGAIIRDWDWYTLEAGYRVIIDGEAAGYIVSDLFFKLKNDGTIVKDHWAHSYTDYKAAKEITTAEAAEMITDALRAFERAGVISDLKVEPLTRKQEPEKTAQEWDEEGERVQAATLAALAPVIVAEAEEEREPVQQFNVSYHLDSAYQTALVNAPEAITARAYFQSIEPDADIFAVKVATRDDQRPGKPELTVPADFVAPEQTGAEIEAITNQAISYAASQRAEKRATARSSARRVYWNTRTQERAESARTALTWYHAGDDVRVTTLNNAGGIYGVSVVKGAEQDTPRDENWEHCKHISDELDKYVDGIMYTCPDCGQVIEMPDDVGDKYCCPCCGCVDEVDEYNQLSVYDFFVDTYDIEYRCDGSREYRSVCIMVACGGPNIYIDTGTGAVELYWWTERAKYHLRSDTKNAVDDWASEMWECR